MPEAPPDGLPALHVENVDVTYGRALSALRSVSLTVPPGAVVALLGANGAGKTTLLRAVSGTLRLHRGAVTAGHIRYGDTVLDGRTPSPRSAPVSSKSRRAAGCSPGCPSTRTSAPAASASDAAVAPRSRRPATASSRCSPARRTHPPGRGAALRR